MDMSLFSVAFRHYLRRMLRDIFSLAIFTILPLIIVAILASVYSQDSSQEVYVQGFNMVTSFLAVWMMLLFQLNGGLYLLNYLNSDFEQPMKWRLQSVPCAKHIFIFACITACTIFTVAQGLLIAAFTRIFMKAYWGNLLVTLLVIILISLFSQLMCIILFLYVKKISTAETISWFVSWIMVAFSGVMFKLPDNAFYHFMAKYGTPFSLAKTAITASGFTELSVATVWICLASLFVIVSIFAVIVIFLGRRKLA